MLAPVHLLWMSEANKKTLKGLPNGFTDDQVIYSLEKISQRGKQKVSCGY